MGLFRFAYRLTASKAAQPLQNEKVRLLVSPHPADESPAVNARAGDSQFTPEISFQRTDNLIDNRPYVPGDDPRRINWKLFGHGSGLFVREGEREPPPHSNIFILVDNEYDPMLYDVTTARHGIDVLCENALAAALACTESEMNVLIGSINGEQLAGNVAGASLAKDLASAMALPAACPLSLDNNFPPVPADRGILILALPRISAETSALDRFLKEMASRFAGNSLTRTVDVFFVCDDNAGHLSAAETCAAMYNRRAGVRARVVGS